ncbi:lipid-A-disaccharide synthase N-terminal domain-containing protein [Psychroserpens algicola]|uniref:Lipid-A-disaccharide synthase N-terminal domain-containing protein n=1 Tax=Psychroserpens algicola TaxID=1719034 RepID=A0ABT0H5D8_9FLAO|nr:lipid-A-disaccharide synthase N-terminal domain-containing protein [Psychroserpens algicola]MCK8479596.1 lipid-A-disaccharide synthase N-terminal domain-containing protein [Psychroserpens algicola]
MSSWLIYGIGFLAQLIFSSRLVIQWLISEQQQRVVTPVLFWILSLIASALLFIYGALRTDFAIMLGQTLTYFIYIRNLQLQKQWVKFPMVIRWLSISFPGCILFYFIINNSIHIDSLFYNKNIPLWLLMLGSIAQIIFVFRFIYQWLISEAKQISSLPLGFWTLSLIGSVLILIYAVIRSDWVLIIGHGFGMLIYTRNIYIAKLGKV